MIDLSEPLRTSLLGNSDLVPLLPLYAGSPAIFTRRPPPGDMVYPCVLILPDVGNINEDGLSDFRPVISRQIVVYSRNDTPEHYRQADEIGYIVYNHFHRMNSRGLILPPASGFSLVDVRVINYATTNQDDQVEGRTVDIDIRLAKKR